MYYKIIRKEFIQALNVSSKKQKTNKINDIKYFFTL